MLLCRLDALISRSINARYAKNMKIAPVLIDSGLILDS